MAFEMEQRTHRSAGMRDCFGQAADPGVSTIAADHAFNTSVLSSLLALIDDNTPPRGETHLDVAHRQLRNVAPLRRNRARS